MAYKQGACTFVFMGGAYNHTKNRISKQDS